MTQKSRCRRKKPASITSFARSAAVFADSAVPCLAKPSDPRPSADLVPAHTGRTGRGLLLGVRGKKGARATKMLSIFRGKETR